MTEPSVETLRRFMDRMAVHAELTARHLDLAPKDALPAMVLAALILAEQHQCIDRVSSRLKLFLMQTGLATKEELEQWRE